MIGFGYAKIASYFRTPMITIGLDIHHKLCRRCEVVHANKCIMWLGIISLNYYLIS